MARRWLRPSKQHFSAFGHLSFLASLRALCVLSIIKEKAAEEGARSAGRSFLPWHGLPYIHLYLIYVHACEGIRNALDMRVSQPTKASLTEDSFLVFIHKRAQGSPPGSLHLNK